MRPARSIWTLLVLLGLILITIYVYQIDEQEEHSPRDDGRWVIDNQSSWSNFERPLEIQQGSGDFCRGHKSPNIVYLLVDDLGYGDVGCNEGKALTPNLNEMANGSHSIHFTRFYAGGPTCSPTRATLLTGRNHNRYCIWHADLGSPIQDLTCTSLVPPK